MGLNKKSVDDINVCRCDFNVPLKAGVITDDNRIVAALPTIKKLIADGGKVILCSHLGKPKGEPKPELSLAPVAARLAECLGQPVVFAADPEVVGPNAKAAVAAMKDGDVVLLENTRYRKEETKNGEAFSKDLASLAEVFVNDAFGTAHRAHCSNVGVTEYLSPCAVGYLMQKEIDFLGKAVEDPVRPFVAILGGAKVADKLNVINNLLEKCDTLIIGGGMAYTFLKAKGYEIGKSLLSPIPSRIRSTLRSQLRLLTLTRSLLTRWAWISDLRPSLFTAMRSRTLRPLSGTDLWAYSRTRSLQTAQSA